MSHLDNVKLFLSWPKAVQEACVSLMAIETPVDLPGVNQPAKPKMEDMRWTDRERTDLWVYIETHGRSHASFESIANALQRSVTAVKNQYFKLLRREKESRK